MLLISIWILLKRLRARVMALMYVRKWMSRARESSGRWLIWQGRFSQGLALGSAIKA